MAASIQSQPPKPPPPPPKVEAAPKPAVEAKPVAQASAAPKPAQTPDLFEQASGGGRGVPTNGGSSFSPSISAAQSPFSSFGSVSDASRQSGAGGFGDFSKPALPDFKGLGDLGNVWGGGAGPVGGSSPSPFMSNGGAPGGVVDKPSPFLNLSNTFSQNFGNGNLDWMLSGFGGGSKPGMGGGMDFLNASGGGAVPFSTTTASQPAVSSQPSNDFRGNDFGLNFNFDFGNNGQHFGLFNFGSARGGGGGAAGGVADRWGQ